LHSGLFDFENQFVMFFFKKISPLFFLLPMACGQLAEPKASERVERFETGAVSRRTPLLNGKKEGKMTDYYPDGKLMAERQFANDKQVGRTVIYYPNGLLKEVQHYTDGLKQGGDTIWYENGQVQFLTTLEQNQKHGYLRKWSPEGKLIYEAKYDHDTLVEVMGKPLDRSAPSLEGN
jgi:antitoxin component YwqK of YwqJK toxin-antitoxin module